MKQPKNPSLYQINTRVWLTEMSRMLGRRATLDDIPNDALDEVADMDFDYIWLLSVWRTGEAAQKISRENNAWRQEFEATLFDLVEEDIAGSGFAIKDYCVHSGRPRQFRAGSGIGNVEFMVDLLDWPNSRSFAGLHLLPEAGETNYRSQVVSFRH